MKRFWATWFISLLVVEGYALYSRTQGDTLSEWTRLKVAVLPMRMALGAMLVWLLFHWLFARPGTLGWRDGASAALGAVLGWIAHRGKRQ